MASLGLVRAAGELEDVGRREPVYSFDLAPKRAISQALFRYCLMAWWEARDGSEETVPFHDVVSGPGSPGRIFRMPESELRSRLEMLGRSQGSTLFQLVLTVWVVLLCRHAGQAEVVIGTPYHGRDAAGTGRSFVGEIDEAWLALPRDERVAIAEQIIDRLRAAGMQQVMIFDDDDQVRIQALGSQPVRVL